MLAASLVGSGCTRDVPYCTFRTWRDVRLESAFGGIAEISIQGRQVRFCTGPITDVGINQTTV
jgi:hypothetical protein